MLAVAIDLREGPMRMGDNGDLGFQDRSAHGSHGNGIPARRRQGTAGATPPSKKSAGPSGAVAHGRLTALRDRGGHAQIPARAIEALAGRTANRADRLP